MSRTSDDQTLLLNIGEASRGIVALFDARLRCMGFTAARGRVLLFLARHDEPVAQAAVTNYLRVEGPTAVRILDGLEALGAIQRLPDPTDRRAKLVELTPEGRPQAERVVRLTRELNDWLLEGVSAGDADVAKSVLAKILDNVGSHSSAVETADELMTG